MAERLENAPYLLLRQRALPSICTALSSQIGLAHPYFGRMRSSANLWICCEPPNNFYIATMEDQGLMDYTQEKGLTSILYAKDESNRCIPHPCCPQSFCPKSFHMKVSEHKEAPPFMEYEGMRGLPCPMKCCCYNVITARSIEGEDFGVVREQFYCCVPSYFVFNESGQQTHELKPPTCLGGQCVNCCYEGRCRFPTGVPFRIHRVFESGVCENDGQIGKMGNRLIASGLKNKGKWYDSFELSFPQKADYATKANLLGAVFLLDQVILDKRKFDMESSSGADDRDDRDRTGDPY
jgi:hypothetical protein